MGTFVSHFAYQSLETYINKLNEISILKEKNEGMQYLNLRGENPSLLNQNSISYGIILPKQRMASKMPQVVKVLAFKADDRVWFLECS